MTQVNLEINLKELLESSKKRPLVIAGPCSAESEEQVIDTAKQLAKSNIDVLRSGVWKPRTRPGSFEGAGPEALNWLNKAKSITGLPVMVEVATTKHVDHALKAGVDMLWIGARTTTNPFSVQEIAEALQGSEIPVFIKNPISPDLQLWIGAIERFKLQGINNIAAIHRGFATAEKNIFRNAPFWNIPLKLKELFPDMPIICDPSHICGKRELIHAISLQALRLGLNGLMIESHNNPDIALSDKEQQLLPDDLAIILKDLLNSNTSIDVNTFDRSVKTLRSEINQIDSTVLQLLSKRFDVCSLIGELKRKSHETALQNNRWDELLHSRLEEGSDLNIPESFIVDLYKLIHSESVRLQSDIINKTA
jgi:chorismate mutase